jgi:hypothetical protein
MKSVTTPFRMPKLYPYVKAKCARITPFYREVRVTEYMAIGDVAYARLMMFFSSYLSGRHIYEQEFQSCPANYWYDGYV